MSAIFSEGEDANLSVLVLSLTSSFVGVRYLPPTYTKFLCDFNSTLSLIEYFASSSASCLKRMSLMSL